MNAAWRSFAEELARWGDAGRRADFWWRDDDATRASPALERLVRLSASVPVALAVVPADAEASLGAALAATVDVLQHGGDHRNRAAPGEKKNEFPPAEAAAGLARIAAGRARLAGLLADRFVPVFAPPWNRMSPGLVGALAGAGLRGLSRFGARAAAHAAPGLPQINTHVDVIAWREGKSFAGEEAVLGAAVRHLAAKRSGAADKDEPTGWLTHHAVHDPGTWDFLERLIEMTLRTPSVRWRAARDLFGLA